MSGKMFVDTNVLVYSVDACDAGKQEAARRYLSQLAGQGQGVVSTQVLQEFYVAATRKVGIEPLEAKALVHSLQGLEVVQVSSELVEEAIDCSILNQLSFWDALIVVAAESANCDVLWTEDLNPGQTIRGVRVENPFATPDIAS